MIGIGSLIFRRAHRKNLITPTKAEPPQGQVADADVDNISKNYPKFNAFIYSMESFIPLIKFDQSSNWMPNANRGRQFQLWWFQSTTGGLYRMYLWFHIIAGWVLTSWWVGLVTGLAKG